VVFPAAISVRTVDDAILSFGSVYEKDAVMLNKRGRLAWSRPDAGRVVLAGTLYSAPVTIRLERIDTGKMLLLSRGFHWINEMPFNR